MPLIATFGSNSAKSLTSVPEDPPVGGGGAGAQETKWYAQFSGTSFRSTYEPAYIQWLQALESASNVTELNAFFGDENNPVYTITDVSYIQGLQNAISSGNDYGSGTTTNWFMGWNCGSPGTTSSFSRGGNNNPSFHFGNSSACSCENTAVIRPLIGNDNWGGRNGGCNQSTQFFGMSFVS